MKKVIVLDWGNFPRKSLISHISSSPVLAQSVNSDEDLRISTLRTPLYVEICSRGLLKLEVIVSEEKVEKLRFPKSIEIM